jgi:hypothetical protein
MVTVRNIRKTELSSSVVRFEAKYKVGLVKIKDGAEPRPGQIE